MKQQTIQENVSKLLKGKDTEQFIKQAKQYQKRINLKIKKEHEKI